MAGKYVWVHKTDAVKMGFCERIDGDVAHIIFGCKGFWSSEDVPVSCLSLA